MLVLLEKSLTILVLGCALALPSAKAEDPVCADGLRGRLGSLVIGSSRRVEVIPGKARITPLTDRPGYYRVERLGSSWREPQGGLGAIFDPNLMVEEVGVEGLELMGVYKEGERSFIFADAERLNGITRNRNLAVAAVASDRYDLKFMVIFYEGDPTAWQVIERYAEDFGWPMSTQGKRALHDWTAHSLANLIDNDLLHHLQDQMTEAVHFRNFVRAHPERFPVLNSPKDASLDFLASLGEEYGTYLDNALGTANLIHMYKPSMFNQFEPFTRATPEALLEQIAMRSSRGSGSEWIVANAEWKDALQAYSKERVAAPTTPYTITPEKIRAGMRKKLGTAAKKIP